MPDEAKAESVASELLAIMFYITEYRIK